jgi:DNA-binding PucR family transcriptional regulator
VVRAGNTITAVIPAGSVALIRSRLEAIQRRLRDAGTQVTLSAGIGPVAREIPEFATSHRDAELCLGLGRNLGKRGLILAREELGILGLFVDAKHPGDLLDNARQVLGPALSYDTEKSGHLIHTLAAYLNHGCDVAASAKELFVHPNTVKYRLRRVEALCELDLHNPDDLLQARITTLTLTLLGD